MKRKAFLFGNTSGLSGIKVDIERFSSFLRDDLGGAWLATEIEVHYDMSKSYLLDRLASIKKELHDYVLLLYSGHAGQIRETTLEINQNEELIEESKLKGLSRRQLSIFDCCRAYPEAIQESAKMESYFALRKSINTQLRERYDRRILQAIPQQATLHSCSIGECSYDTRDGAIYLTNLLKSAASIASGFKLVGVAHQEAIPATIEYSRKQKHGTQNPDADLPKCLSSQQLIISLK